MGRGLSVLCACVGTGGPASGAPIPTAPWEAGWGGLAPHCALALQGGARAPVCSCLPCHLIVRQAHHCPGDMQTRPPYLAPLEGSLCPCKLGFCLNKLAPPAGGPTLARAW